MNVKGELEIDWADGTYSFRLVMSGIVELEEKCAAPIADIVTRVNAGRYSFNDVRETIRLGLIGAGMSKLDALKMVRRHVDERPLADNSLIARAILLGVMFGFSEYPLAQAAEEEASEQSVSTPPPSSTKFDDLGLSPEFWTTLASGNGAPS